MRRGRMHSPATAGCGEFRKLKLPARRAVPAAAFAVLALLAAGVSAAADSIVLGRFSAGDLSAWEAKSFVGETAYRLVDGRDGKILEAVSRASASGLILERRIDLTATPVLAWRWRVSGPVNPPDEKTRDGDDFAARIYFVTPGQGLFSLPKSISYVWASRQPVGSSWPNPYTDNVRMVAVDSGSRHVGEWRSHRRNLREDFRTLFGRDITEITHVAIMTDTDNSGLSAHSWYGDIRLEAVGNDGR